MKNKKRMAGLRACMGSLKPTTNNQQPTTAPAGRKGLSPRRLFLLRFGRNRTAVVSALVLGMLYLAALLAGFIAPYAMDRQNRQSFYHPPTILHWRDGAGLSLRPFVYEYGAVDKAGGGYQEGKVKRHYVRLFVKGDKYKFIGLVPVNVHLFGVDEPGRVHLLGTDRFGRDIFSRLLYGAQISLSIGLVGIIITFFIGLSVG
ncbi:MAG: hypothetical protein PHT33_15215, partial [bacterium]|nr:hypothetical protein [bacterium]